MLNNNNLGLKLNEKQILFLDSHRGDKSRASFLKEIINQQIEMERIPNEINDKGEKH